MCKLDTLLNISKNIDIIYEVDSNTHPQIDQAYELLATSKYIFFLGFGYHKLNVERLKISQCNKPTFHVTCLDWKPEELIRIIKQVPKGIRLDNTCEKKATDFLRTNARFQELF